MVPYAGFSFYCFERLKHLLLTNFAVFCAKPGSDQKVLSIPAKLLCGGFAGKN
jgi:solute carrier family 25 protein 16